MRRHKLFYPELLGTRVRIAVATPDSSDVRFHKEVQLLCRLKQCKNHAPILHHRRVGTASGIEEVDSDGDRGNGDSSSYRKRQNFVSLGTQYVF